MSSEIYDHRLQCPNCGNNAELCYVHWGEVKDYCKDCDLTFIYNLGDPFNTIEFVERDYYSSQELIKTKNLDYHKIRTTREKIAKLFYNLPTLPKPLEMFLTFKLIPFIEGETNHRRHLGKNCPCMRERKN